MTTILLIQMHGKIQQNKSKRDGGTSRLTGGSKIEVKNGGERHHTEGHHVDGLVLACRCSRRPTDDDFARQRLCGAVEEGGGNFKTY